MASYASSGASPMNAIVADVGSYATKIGWAGDDQPKSYFRSNVAVLRDDTQQSAHQDEESDDTHNNNNNSRSSITKVRYDYLSQPIGGYPSRNYSEVNKRQEELDGKWDICNPVDPVTGLWYDPKTARASTAAGASSADGSNNNNSSNNANNHTEPNQQGSGADWADLLPQFLRHGCQTGLNVMKPKTNNNTTTTDPPSWDYPLLMVEKSYNPPPIRQQLVEILLEEMAAPAVFLGKDAVLSCYGCGRTNGTVVDMGYSGTTVTPVYEGYAEAVLRSPIGLAALDERIVQHLDQLHYNRKKRRGGIVPLYQVKQERDFGWEAPKQLIRRKAVFHHQARLNLAVECRAQGAGIAIDTTALTAPSAAGSTAAAVTFQAPNKVYKLPDGGEFSLTSQFRFQSAKLLLGKPQIVQQPSAPTDGSAAPAPAPPLPPPTADQETRLEWYRENYQAWMNYMEQQQAAVEETEAKNAALDPLQNNNSTTAETDFSDAAAVGIAKRRTKRLKSAPPAAAAAAKPQTTRRTYRHFNNARLNAACHKYFQTLLPPSSDTDDTNSTTAQQSTQQQQQGLPPDSFLSAAPIAQMICQAAYKCDRDQQASLLGNVVLGGGGACLGPTEQAVPDLIKEQVEALIHTHTPNWRVKVLSPSFAERSVLPWLGGSILGSLSTFPEMWITKADYDEWGSAIVNRKCP